MRLGETTTNTQDILKNNYLTFPLPIKNYNDLRVEAVIPRILIVLLMPEADALWMSQSEEELCLRRCAYWLSLEGRHAVPNNPTSR